MKLCRFELKNDPGRARSGMVHSGRIYETEGANAVGVHLAEAIRPLSPIPHAPSLRFFHTGYQPSEVEMPWYFFGNSAGVFGPSQVIELPESVDFFDVEPYLVIISASDIHRADPELLDDAILGYTLMLQVVDRNLDRMGNRHGVGFGPSRDIGGALGPVITTPEELDDYVVDVENGRQLRLEVAYRINGVEKARSNLELLPITGAQALASASQNGHVKTGDLLAIGPLVDLSDLPGSLTRGDEISIAVECLGTLSISTS